jgi:hypothetical protein
LIIIFGPHERRRGSSSSAKAAKATSCCEIKSNKENAGVYDCEGEGARERGERREARGERATVRSMDDDEMVISSAQLEAPRTTAFSSAGRATTDR